MRYVKQVVSTVKKSCSVQLGPKTLLVGPNGSGKTTVIQSIELATSGFATDLEGRDLVQQQGALQRLFPDNAIPSAECWLDDGTHFIWEMKPKTGQGAEGFHEPSGQRPIPVHWPLREIQQVLLGDASKVARWLEEQVIGTRSLEEVIKDLPPEVKAEVIFLSKKAGNSDLMALANLAKNEARALRMGATKLEKTIEQMVVGIPSPLTDFEVQNLKADLAKATAAPVGITQDQHAALKRLFDLKSADWVRLEEEKHQIPKVSSNLLAALDRLNKAKGLSRQHQAYFHDAAACFVCGKGTAEDLKKYQVELDTLVATVSSSVSKEDMDRRTSIEQTQAQIIVELRQLKAQMDQPIIEPSSIDVGIVQGKLASNEVSVRAWANYEASRKSLLRDRVKADHLTTASKILSELGKSILQKKKAEFEAKVNQYLPSSDVFTIDLHASRVGLKRGSDLHTALSGAEYSRVLLALAAVCFDPNGISILAPPDRAWDAQTLSLVMSSLSSVEAQVIIMSTVQPAHVPPGWTVVTVGQ